MSKGRRTQRKQPPSPKTTTTMTQRTRWRRTATAASASVGEPASPQCLAAESPPANCAHTSSPSDPTAQRIRGGETEVEEGVGGGEEEGTERQGWQTRTCERSPRRCRLAPSACGRA